jgi:cysteine desulfurase
MNQPIYLDHHATTPLDPRVLTAMLPYLKEHFGNPASRNHRWGWTASTAVEKAREECGRLIKAPADRIVFTSSATESINLALKGVALAAGTGRHLIASTAEHRAVLDSLERLATRGHRVTLLPVDRYGQVDPADFAAAIEPETILASFLFANNEIGTINRIRELGGIARDRGILFHTDATQAAGRLPIDLADLPVDLLSASAHKFYGPKGAGFLYWRKRSPAIRIEPLIDGGGHEKGLRSGTLNVPAIVGMGEAARIAGIEMSEEARRIGALRERLRERLVTEIEETIVNGHPVERLPGNLNLAFSCVEGEALLVGLAEIALSTGSACSSAFLKQSHVLKAIGLSRDQVTSSVRIGLGRWNTEEEIDRAAARIIEEVRRLRSISPQWASR